MKTSIVIILFLMPLIGISQTFTYDVMNVYTRNEKGYLPPVETKVVWNAYFDIEKHIITLHDTLNKGYIELSIISNEVKGGHYKYEVLNKKDTCIIDVFSENNFYILDFIHPDKLIRYTKKR
jgi:hypothetical protein